MPRVVSLSNHPYGSRMITKGEQYDIDEADLALHQQLKRVRTLTKSEADKHAQTYKTRDLQPEQGGIMGTRGTIQPHPIAPAAPAPPVAAPPAAKPAIPKPAKPSEPK